MTALNQAQNSKLKTQNSKLVCAWLAAHEGLGVLACAPLLLFPTPVSVILGVGLLAGLRLVAWRATGCAVPAGAPGLPALWLLGMAAVGMAISIDPALSLPRLAGLLLGLGVFYATVTDARQRPWPAPAGRIALAPWALLTGGGALALLMPLVVDWAEKAPAWLPPDVYATWPGLFHNVLRDSLGRVQDGFAANAVAGMLALLLPPVLALATLPRAAGVPGPRLAAGAAVIMALALLATQSRGGLLAAGAAVGLFLAWRYPRARRRLLVGGVAAAALVAVALLGAHGAPIRAALAGVPVETQSDTALFRLALWDRALAMIADHPFTGVGLNNFPVVQQQLYPLFPTQPDALVIHAHNVYLQTALDFGLPGLLALLAFGASIIRAVAPRLGLPIFDLRFAIFERGTRAAQDAPKVPDRASCVSQIEQGKQAPDRASCVSQIEQGKQVPDRASCVSQIEQGKQAPDSASSVSKIENRKSKIQGVWLAGCCAGLTAGALFGLTDALAVGSRPGLLAWLIAGLAVGAVPSCSPAAPLGPRLHPALATLVWATVSLAVCTLAGMV